MKAEIQKILEMSKAGTISDEQAAVLLEEVAQNQAKKDQPESMTSAFSDFVQNAIGGAFRAHHKQHGFSPLQDADGNRIHLSKFDPPSGNEAVFKDNSITMSCATRLELDHAEMTSNSLNASKLDRLRLSRARWHAGSINGSAVDRLEATDTILDQVKINACKVTRFWIERESRLERVRFDGCSFKRTHITEATQWLDSSVGATAVDRLELIGATLKDCKLEASKVDGLKIERSSLDGFGLQGMRIDQLVIDSSELSRVSLSGGDSWRWQGLSKTRFENCRLENVNFSECRIKNTVLRNLTLKDLDVRQADLSGLTLDGNEAFLKAVGRFAIPQGS